MSSSAMKPFEGKRRRSRIEDRGMQSDKFCHHVAASMVGDAQPGCFESLYRENG